jgi:lipoprotein-anchoring transpeptidase ErfK/SrfK
MNLKVSRRDLLKLGGLSAASFAFSPMLPRGIAGFDDSTVVRVATNSVSIYSEPSDKSRITGTWYRDDLVHVYEEVVAKEPAYNPVWYRVWGGYMHRSRLQRVKNIPNIPLESIPEGTRVMGEVTVPYTQPWRSTKLRGWEPINPRLYYESVHWLEAVEEGPDGNPWYKIFDELTGTYYAPASPFRPIPNEELAPISPEIPWEEKRIDVNLATQILSAYEYDKVVFQTNVSSGIPAGRTDPRELSTKTPDGEFHIQEKMPSKHMGNGNLLADADGYELPGVPWTLFFTEAGHAFHGTYWHENYGTPMSHGCINMRTSEAKWLFRWARPLHTQEDLSTKYYFRGYGTTVTIHY